MNGSINDYSGDDLTATFSHQVVAFGFYPVLNTRNIIGISKIH